MCSTVSELGMESSVSRTMNASYVDLITAHPSLTSTTQLKHYNKMVFNQHLDPECDAINLRSSYALTNIIVADFHVIMMYSLSTLHGMQATPCSHSLPLVFVIWTWGR